jgi:hypothetical protein
MKHLKLVAVIITGNILLAACNKNDGYGGGSTPPQVQSTVVSSAGDVTAALTQFKTLLGDPVNGTPGQTVGRREVNWEGVPVANNNNNTFPLDFFNLTDPTGANGRKRGLVYVNTGSPIRIDSSAFTEIDASYPAQFKAFSGKRALIASGSNVSEIIFKVPGTNTDAFVKGFGIVFSDVDNTNFTTLEFFNGNTSLGVFKAPARNDANGFSFLGVFFPNDKVTRIKITAGNGALGAGLKDITDGGAKDLVVYDDFFYNEPLPIN